MELPARINGLHRPFHPFQITSWILQVYNIVAFYSSSVPCFHRELRIPLAILYSILQFSTIFLGYKLSKSNPTDQTVLKFKSTKDKNLAIQLEEMCDRYCNFCRSPVESNSKHCVRCNRCTSRFDHHCKWVNNCVGSSNYRLFIMLINSCFLLELFLFIVCSNIVKDSIINSSGTRDNIGEFYHTELLLLFQVIQAFLSLEGLIFSMLLLYLICLHIYLNYKGFTTYEYILQKRSHKQVIPKDKKIDTSTALNSSSLYIQEKPSVHRMSKSDAELKVSPRI